MKFRVLNIITILVLAVMLGTNYVYAAQIAWWWFAVAIWLYLSIVFYGCVTISSGFFMPVICKADTKEQAVALSFDDGPDATYTSGILDTLKKHNVPAAFFCIGSKIAGHSALMQRIKDEGHITGNHSFSHHFWFDMFGSSKMLDDMQQMDGAVNNAAGVKPLLFRPPYGVMNPNLTRAIKRGGYTPIGWSIRSLDTTAKDKQKLLLRITSQLKPGAIILLHDTMAITTELLPELIEQIKSKGYSIVRLDTLLNIKAYA